MYDQPEPTEEEEQASPERLREEEAMSGTGHDDPEAAQGEEEIHDA